MSFIGTELSVLAWSIHGEIGSGRGLNVCCRGGYSGTRKRRGKVPSALEVTDGSFDIKLE